MTYIVLRSNNAQDYADVSQRKFYIVAAVRTKDGPSAIQVWHTVEQNPATMNKVTLILVALVIVFLAWMTSIYLGHGEVISGEFL